MATLSDTDRTYVQQMTGIGTAGTLFSDAVLDAFYTRAEGNVEQTIVTVLRALMADAAKLYDYRIAQTGESQSQVFAQLQKTLLYWEDRVARAGRQVKIVGMTAVPPRRKDQP